MSYGGCVSAARTRSPSSRSRCADRGWDGPHPVAPGKDEEIMTIRPLASRAADREPVADVEIRPAFLVRSEETNGQFSLAEGVLLRGRVPPPHIHHNEDESFYVLEGEF